MSDERVRSPIVVTHDGGMRFATHIRSHLIVTDQPLYAGGTDTGPAPIELLGASLGSCVAFYVQQFCAARGFSCEGMRVEVDTRSAKAPSRVGEFIVRVIMPPNLPEEWEMMLERVVRSCPAHNTLTGGAGVSIEILVPTPV